MATSAPLRLAHLHLHSPIPYTHSLRLQEAVLARHFAYRDALRSSQASLSPPPPSSSAPPPPPTLLTFSTHPTYTVGRRHLQSKPISAAQQAFLSNTDSSSLGPRAEFHASPRGGLLTYHAPGQLTAYAIVDLRRHGLSPRCYVRLLEKSVMRTCAAAAGVANVGTSADPGVWILDPATGTVDGEGRKICAVGVQVSRGVTSHGIGLNVVDAPMPEFTPGEVSTAAALLKNPSSKPQGYLSWGFSRIVACGLEGKSVTWLSRERLSSPPDAAADEDLTVSHVATVFAQEFARGLSAEGTQTIDGVVTVAEIDVLGLD